MLKEFIDFAESVLPSVDPDLRDGAKKAITQFEREGKQVNLLAAKPLEDLSQGDIISNVPFAFFDKNGNQKTFTAAAFVLSTSCHIDQKDKLILAPILPLDAYENKNIDDLKKNTVFDYMYISDGCMKDKFINFQIMTTYNKELITSGLENGKLQRTASLNQIGYYFFVVKLTVYFMRKEDSDTLKHRSA